MGLPHHVAIVVEIDCRDFLLNSLVLHLSQRDWNNFDHITIPILFGLSPDNWKTNGKLPQSPIRNVMKIPGRAINEKTGTRQQEDSFTVNTNVNSYTDAIPWVSFVYNRVDRSWTFPCVYTVCEGWLTEQMT